MWEPPSAAVQASRQATAPAEFQAEFKNSNLRGKELFLKQKIARARVMRKRRVTARNAAGLQRRRRDANTNALLVPIDLFALLVALLRFHRQRRNGTGFQPLQRDGFPGLLAIAVGVVLDSLQRRVDLGDQLALAGAGTQFNGTVSFGRGTVGEIGMIDVFFLQRLQRQL